MSRVVLVAKQASAPTTHWAPTRALGSAARAATTLVVIPIVCSNQAAFSIPGLICLRPAVAHMAYCSNQVLLDYCETICPRPSVNSC